MLARLAALLLLLPLGACSSSIWQESYRPSPLAPQGPAPTRLPPSTPILVREAPWDRVDAALAQLARDEAASDIHISQWPEDRRLHAVASILLALQLQDDPAQVIILGSSSFATTDPIRPDSGALEAHARRLGADTAIWTSRVLGRGTRVVDRPVTIHHHGWDRYYDRDDHVWRSQYDSHLDTAWVPVTIDADRVAYVAFYLRRSAPTPTP